MTRRTIAALLAALSLTAAAQPAHAVANHVEGTVSYSINYHAPYNVVDVDGTSNTLATVNLLSG